MTLQKPVAAERPVPWPATVDGPLVTHVEHWTDRLFSFRVERPRSLRFRSGEFVMIGLPNDNGKPILRAYSIASPAWAEELEFYSIKVQDGPLTSRLQHIRPGDRILLKERATGTLVLDALIPGRRLYMIATGTGIAPFASLIRDPETYEKFSDVILTHTCRQVAELGYGQQLVAAVQEDPLIGEMAAASFRHYPSVTREPFERTDRITKRIEAGTLFSDLDVPPFDPAVDRVMICGSIGLNTDMRALCEAAGLAEGSNARPAEFVVERAFVG